MKIEIEMNLVGIAVIFTFYYYSKVEDSCATRGKMLK